MPARPTSPRAAAPDLQDVAAYARADKAFLTAIARIVADTIAASAPATTETSQARITRLQNAVLKQVAARSA